MNRKSVNYSTLNPLNLSRFTILLFIIFGFTIVSHAQKSKVQDIAPPPLTILSDGEKKQLAAEKDVKDRTQLAIELMESRLAKSETLCEQKLYRESLDELGNFQALVTDALKYLNRNNTGRKKVHYNFKRLDINLRQLLPRLELLRRKMPFRYAYYVKDLMKYVSKTRAKATDSLFANTVLPNNEPDN